MDSTHPPPAGLSPFERRLVYSAVVELAEDVIVVGHTADLLAVHDLPRRAGAIVVTLGAEDAALAARVKQLLGTWTVKSTAVIVVGPEDRGLALKKLASPRLTRGRLFWTGVTEDGVSWGERVDGPLAATLPRVLDPNTSLDWTKIADRTRQSDTRVREQQGFAARLKARRPWVTYALVAANLLMFALQAILVGTEPNVRALLRMGGMSRDLVAQGEVWRLLSAAFLHGGLMHLGFNVAVLWALGSFVERIIGPRRFLILYTACAMAGSIGSALFMGASVSVGASGALWGILAAHAVFAFAPGFLPAAAVSGARRAALINLGLNVMVSFQPHIDWAAHLGGGLVGAALLYLVLARGVPRGDTLANEDPAPFPGQNVLTGLCALLLLVGAVSGPVLGGAFASSESTPSYERVAIDGANATIEVPVGMRRGPANRTVGGRVEQSFGNVMLDRAAVGVAFITLGPIPEADLPAEIAGLLDVLNTPPAHATNVAPAEAIDVPDFRAAVRASYRFESDLRLDVVVVLDHGHLLRAEAYYFPDEAHYGAGVARHVAESLRVE